jgi:hypothetical protein
MTAGNVGIAESEYAGWQAVTIVIVVKISSHLKECRVRIGLHLVHLFYAPTATI